VSLGRGKIEVIDRNKQKNICNVTWLHTPPWLSDNLLSEDQGVFLMEG